MRKMARTRPMPPGSAALPRKSAQKKMPLSLRTEAFFKIRLQEKPPDFPFLPDLPADVRPSRAASFSQTASEIFQPFGGACAGCRAVRPLNRRRLGGHMVPAERYDAPDDRKAKNRGQQEEKPHGAPAFRLAVLD